ncbi:MAG: hypothetical protein R2851_13600 [Caldilineaceae bacterium]
MRRAAIWSITGIPWYYRQFGYEMTVNLSGGAPFSGSATTNLTTKPAGDYHAYGHGNLTSVFGPALWGGGGQRFPAAQCR